MYPFLSPGMLIIGASDAGIPAALRIREIDINAEVMVMAKDAYPNFDGPVKSRFGMAK